MQEHLQDVIRRLQRGAANLQKAPATPSTIQAGVDGDGGRGPAPALDDHVHPIETSAPTIPIELGQAASEGDGTALLRADATFDTTLLEAQILALTTGGRRFAFFISRAGR